MNEFDNLVTIVGRWTVTVELTYVDDRIAAATQRSKIKPLMLPNGKCDQLALDEYTDFVVNLLNVFDEAGFEVIEERQSPKSFSYYFDLVKKDQANKKDYKYILFVRISDHELSPDQQHVQRNWFNDYAQKLKQPESKSYQRWQLKKITVNKDTYFSYDEALADIENKLVNK